MHKRVVVLWIKYLFVFIPSPGSKAVGYIIVILNQKMLYKGSQQIMLIRNNIKFEEIVCGTVLFTGRFNLLEREKNLKEERFSWFLLGTWSRTTCWSRTRVMWSWQTSAWAPLDWTVSSRWIHVASKWSPAGYKNLLILVHTMYLFVPPGSGSVIICTDPDPSINKQKLKNTLISPVLRHVIFEGCNCTTESNTQKNLRIKKFLLHLESHWRKEQDPDSDQEQDP